MERAVFRDEISDISSLHESDLSISEDDHFTNPVLKKKKRRSSQAHTRTSIKGSGSVENDEYKKRAEILFEENLRKDAQLEQQKNAHLLAERQWQEKISSLTKELHHYQQQAETSGSYFRSLQERTRNEVDSLRNKIVELERQHPVLIERLSVSKEEMKDLKHISEPMYLEIKSKDEKDWGIRDLVFASVYEMNSKHRVERDGLRKELEHTKNDLFETKLILEKLQKEHATLEKFSSQKEKDLRIELEAERNRASKLQNQLTDKSIFAEQLSGKGEMYDELKNTLSKLEHEATTLKSENMFLNVNLKSLTEEKDDLTKRILEITQSYELSKMDKTYLNKELESIQNLNRKLNDQVERQHQKLRDLKQSREELFQKLIKSREEHKTSYEEKLQTEVDRLRTQTVKDLEEIKVNSKESYERELRSLKEQRDNALSEAERVQSKLNELRTAYKELQESQRIMVANMDNQIATLTSQLKMKCFEYERLSITYEEVNAHLTQAKLDIEKHRKKVELLTSEYYSLQTSSEKKISELETTIEENQQKLAEFEGLEEGLDNALISSSNTENTQEGLIFSVVGNSLPNSSRRRIKQTVQLSRKLLDLERANRDLIAELEMKKSTDRAT
eukprot:TRINITY_DN5833_c0_g1_i2.p1 TRINITY_DN5833_c0_g1~~TRINITY_DN5833_c0_g1_i2.p1  ORF type:complete len:619 (+),score=172.02 TRINITY_DN5833_c0_g1_i2:109-1965(+)